MDAFGYDLGADRPPRRRRPDGERAQADAAGARLRGERGPRPAPAFSPRRRESTERDEREGMAAVQAEGHDGVRVMTVHAAKGLQFPVVAVPDLGRGLAAGHRNADLVIGPPPGPSSPSRTASGCGSRFAAAKSFGLWELTDLNEAESVAEAEEGCRLVYVAASRAEDRLILSGGYKPSDLEPAERAEAQRLAAAAPAAGARRARLGRRRRGSSTLPGPRPIDGRAARRTRARDPDLRAERRARRRAGAPLRPAPPSPSRWRASRVAAAGRRSARRRCRSATSPTRRSPLYERCGYRFYVERVLGARERAGRGRRRAADDEPAEPRDELAEPERAARRWRSGSATRSTRRSSGAPARLGARRRDELLGGCSPREGASGDEAAARRAATLVGGWLDSRPARASSAAAPIAARGAVRARARADRDPRADRPAGRVRRRRRRRSIDYKTDALGGRRPAELAERYRAQREVYALAAGRADGGPRACTSSSRRPTTRSRSRSAPTSSTRRASGSRRWSSGCAAGEFEADRRAVRGALLRLPGGGAPLPAPGVAARRHEPRSRSSATPRWSARRAPRRRSAGRSRADPGAARGLARAAGRWAATTPRSEKTFARPDGSRAALLPRAQPRARRPSATGARTAP